MRWTAAPDLKAQAARLWDRGELLRPLVTDEAIFPIRLTLRGPGSSEITDRFEAVRTWAAELAAVTHVRLDWREVRHRVQGSQSLPVRAWVDTPDDAFALLGKRRDAERFSEIVKSTRNSLPALLPWLARRPLQALDLADQWPRLVAVVCWLTDNPRPRIYLRQVDIPGVHSKFIETHRAVLSELMDLALPAEAIEPGQTGVSRFAGRFGFLDKPTRIRLRVLDEHVPLLSGAAYPDVTLDSDSFAALDIPVIRVFITENETNFLAFPPAPGAIVIFGGGYGWEALSRARWLTRCAIYYWGDIDTHGFAILDRLRNHFGHVSSFLMDRETLDAHQIHWTEEPDQVLHDLPRLTDAETALFCDLRDNRIRRKLRLEQERVSFQWVTDGLSRIPAG